MPCRWADPVVFLGAMSDSVLFLGIVLPVETILLLSGYLAWRGELSLPLVMLLGAMGATAGDAAGYEIGRRYGQSVRHTRPGQWVGERRWEAAHHLLDRYHAPAIFFARYVTGVRSITPMLAGDTGLPYPRFALWNVLGSITWGALFVTLGWIAGPAYETVGAATGVVGVVLMVVIVVSAALFIRRQRRRLLEQMTDQPSSAGS
ncbi:MAG: DedA family protein [Acidimicrobiia bacterium]|nr:DedA family protein [Acidimicrobiia bacterium]